jgi:hypothetical protein
MCFSSLNFELILRYSHLFRGCNFASPLLQLLSELSFHSEAHNVKFLNISLNLPKLQAIELTSLLVPGNPGRLDTFMYRLTVENLRREQTRQTHLRSYHGNLKNEFLYKFHENPTKPLNRSCVTDRMADGCGLHIRR